MTATKIIATACGRTFPGGVRALHPTDLTVEPGETLVLLGPSGCGKTTLLRLLSGLDTPDTGGKVVFERDGKSEDVTDRPIEKRGVGMVFQSYALFPNMTVGENVAYGPKLRGLSRKDRRDAAQKYLELCRIEALADRRVTELSGGQRQRVALARALAAEPRALFLDEPLTALDATLRETLREEIAELLGRLSVTSVYVTHDQSEAMALADRIVVMSEGRIEMIGRPRDVYERPTTRFVAEFVGETNPCPSQEGQVRLVRPEYVTIVAEGEGALATVTAATYLGASTRVSLQCGDRTLSAFDHQGRVFQPGERVGLIIDESRIMEFCA